MYNIGKIGNNGEDGNYPLFSFFNDDGNVCN